MFTSPDLIEEVSALPQSEPGTPTFKDSSFRKAFDNYDFQTPSPINFSSLPTPETASATPDDHVFAIP